MQMSLDLSGQLIWLKVGLPMCQRFAESSLSSELRMNEWMKQLISMCPFDCNLAIVLIQPHNSPLCHPHRERERERKRENNYKF